MAMNVNPRNYWIKQIMGYVQHYNPDKYWHRRQIVVEPNNKVPYIIKLWFLYYIKKCDAFNNASMGTDINQGAQFITRPILPHGLNGIIIHLQAKIGSNVTICQQVTIGDSWGKNVGLPEIGDNVKIGAGAKILGGIKIGKNCIIGANAVVTKDIPDNTTVVGARMRYLPHEE